MTPLQQFRLAIKTAEKNGWDFLGFEKLMKKWGVEEEIGWIDERPFLQLVICGDELEVRFDLMTVLGDLNFRKAVFGGKVGWDKKVEDIINEHKWELELTRNDTTQTKVYHCKICPARKENNTIYYETCDGSIYADSPCLCTTRSYLEPHGVKYHQGFFANSRQMFFQQEPLKMLKWLAEWIKETK